MNHEIIPDDPNQIENDRDFLRRLLDLSDGKVDSLPDSEPAGEDGFLKLLAKAAEEILDNWSISLLNARYGIYSEQGMTVKEIARRSRMNEEWIEAQLESVLEELSVRGRRQIEVGKTDMAAARLVQYVQQLLRPDEPGYERRLLEETIKEMPSLLGDPFAAYALAAFTTDSHVLLSAQTWLSLTSWASGEGRTSFHVTVNPKRRSDTDLGDMLEAIYWPPRPLHLSADDYHHIRRIPMEGSEQSGFLVHTIYSEKVGKEFETRTFRELELFDELEQCEEIAYFEQHPFRIPDLEEPSAGKTIVPAFAAILRDGRLFVIRLVDAKDLAHEMHGISTLSTRRFCDEHRFGLLVTDGRETPLSLSRIPLRMPKYLTLLTETLQNDAAGRATNLSEANITYRELAGVVARDKRYWVPDSWGVTTRMPDVIDVGPVQDG